MPIYCDEAGYTGYNLLEENQPYFVYAALNIEDIQAKEFISSVRAKYRLQGEPKGANWVKTNNGRKAIVELYANFADKVRIVHHHKKYALACKYFEYVFEPTISDNNIPFYRMQFHRFIASLAFVAFESSEKKAEDLFWTFQELLRGNDPNGLFDFLKTKKTPNDLVSMMAQFTVLHREAIIDEISTDGEFSYWILDLAQTALHSLLCIWSMEKGALAVVIDESKPLREAVANNALYHRFNSEIAYHDPFGYGQTAINFSLSEPVQFSKSKHVPGLQMADLFASTVYWALNNPKDSFAELINSHRDKYIPSPHNYCISPEPEMYLDPQSIQFSFGVTALNRLLQFSKESTSGIAKKFIDHMLSGVEEFKRLNGA
ncbi:hypothetical protein D3C87_219420 [compost metagenome]